MLPTATAELSQCKSMSGTYNIPVQCVPKSTKLKIHHEQGSPSGFGNEKEIFPIPLWTSLKPCDLLVPLLNWTKGQFHVSYVPHFPLNLDGKSHLRITRGGIVNTMRAKVRLFFYSALNENKFNGRYLRYLWKFWDVSGAKINYFLRFARVVTGNCTHATNLHKISSHPINTRT